MTSRGIRGQTVASPTMGVTLFGGFDDHFLRLDGFTGRIDKVPARGRTLLFPWNESLFVMVEDCLGRPSMTELSLRAIAEPAKSVTSVLAGDMPARLDEEWGAEPRLIPSLYPCAFAVEDRQMSAIELDAGDFEGRVEFAPGVFNQEVAVVVDGRVELLVGPTGPAAQLGIDGQAVVGRGDRWWIAGASGLTMVDKAGSIEVAPAAGDPWRPQSIEHDPVQSVLLVASWNRWGSLGGPTTDVYVASEVGALVSRARLPALVERMGLESGAVAAVDVNGQVHTARLE